MVERMVYWTAELMVYWKAGEAGAGLSLLGGIRRLFPAKAKPALVTFGGIPRRA